MPAPGKEGFEEQMEALERIVEELESGESTLEESLQRYLDGVKRLQACREFLEKAEEKVRMVQRTAGGAVEEVPFPDEE